MRWVAIDRSSLASLGMMADKFGDPRKGHIAELLSVESRLSLLMVFSTGRGSSSSQLLPPTRLGFVDLANLSCVRDQCDEFYVVIQLVWCTITYQIQPICLPLLLSAPVLECSELQWVTNQ